MTYDKSYEKDSPMNDKLTEDDLRERSAALDEAQVVYEEVSYLANPKMPCPECGGSGQVAGGSLGDVCVRCGGARVLDRPDAEKIWQPPFAELRAAITAYGTALADRELPDGHKGKRGLALPAPETVPTLAQLQKLGVDGRKTFKQLQGTAGVVPQHLLHAPEPEKGMRSEGDLSEYSDAEIATMEEQAERKPR